MHMRRIASCLAGVVALSASMARSAPANPEDTAMQKVHERLSVDCFNRCWTLIDKPDRTPEDTENMILLASASLWHWKQRADCGPLQLSIGCWQLARVHALAGHAAAAEMFGRQSLDLCRSHGLPPFHLGAAHEALARAAALRKDAAALRDHLAAGRRALEQVTHAGERAILKSDLDGIEQPPPGRAKK